MPITPTPAIKDIDKLITMREKLTAKLEEIDTMLRDGLNIPPNAYWLNEELIKGALETERERIDICIDAIKRELQTRYGLEE